MPRAIAGPIFALVFVLLLAYAWAPLARWLGDTLQLGGWSLGAALAVLAIGAAVVVRWARDQLS